MPNRKAFITPALISPQSNRRRRIPAPHDTTAHRAGVPCKLRLTPAYPFERPTQNRHNLDKRSEQKKRRNQTRSQITIAHNKLENAYALAPSGPVPSSTSPPPGKKPSRAHERPPASAMTSLKKSLLRVIRWSDRRSSAPPKLA